jgi:hypothetical protein
MPFRWAVHRTDAECSSSRSSPRGVRGGLHAPQPAQRSRIRCRSGIAAGVGRPCTTVSAAIRTFPSSTMGFAPVWRLLTTDRRNYVYCHHNAGSSKGAAATYG